MAEKTEILCKKHGFVEHLLNSTGSDRPRAYRCTTCRNEMRNLARRRAKTKAVEYKGGRCSACGYSKCAEALEFHHLSGKDKSFEISERRDWNALRSELDKCLLLCANCHREIHAQNRAD